jgi:5'-deoxynucleotidase
VSHFFAYLARMKFIQRWGLMRNTSTENIQEHSLQVAMIAHALALIANQRLGAMRSTRRGPRCWPSSTMPRRSSPATCRARSSTSTPQVRDAVGDLSGVAKRKLLDMAPPALRPMYEPLFFAQAADADAWRLVKLADKICAYLKCVEEAKAGNREFERPRSRSAAASRRSRTRTSTTSWRRTCRASG